LSNEKSQALQPFFALRISRFGSPAAPVPSEELVVLKNEKGGWILNQDKVHCVGRHNLIQATADYFAVGEA
jgi:hypothetical protein